MRKTSDAILQISRRHWTAVIAAAPLIAQLPSSAPQALPAPATTPSTGQSIRKVSERLAQIEVPMSLEPAFSFHS